VSLLRAPVRERSQVAAQTLDHGGRSLTATGIEIRATEGASRGERANALTAAWTNMGSAGSHISNQTMRTYPFTEEPISGS
jgi:hypothetical protein